MQNFNFRKSIQSSFLRLPTMRIPELQVGIFNA